LFTGASLRGNTLANREQRPAEVAGKTRERQHRTEKVPLSQIVSLSTSRNVWASARWLTRHRCAKTHSDSNVATRQRRAEAIAEERASAPQWVDCSWTQIAPLSAQSFTRCGPVAAETQLRTGQAASRTSAAIRYDSATNMLPPQ